MKAHWNKKENSFSPVFFNRPCVTSIGVCDPQIGPESKAGPRFFPSDSIFPHIIISILAWRHGMLDETVLFRETQYFRKWWLVLPILGEIALLAYMAVRQLLLHQPVGDRPVSDAVMWLLFLIFGMALPAFLLSIHLSTEVRTDGLYIRFFPFHLGFKKISGIRDIEACQYRPIADYGGWGIRYGKSGKAYTMYGKSGIMIITEDGQKLLIGSQQATELENALSTLLSKKKS
jgi:hypothetical protein